MVARLIAGAFRVGAFPDAAIREIKDAYRMAVELDDLLRVAVAGMQAFDPLYRHLTDAVPIGNRTSNTPMERISLRQPVRPKS